MLKLTDLKDARFSAIDSDVEDALVLHKGLILAGGALS